MDAQPLLVVQLCDDDGPGRVGDWLTAAGCDLDVRRVDRGEPLPADFGGHSGLLVLGGEQSAYDTSEKSPELGPVLDVLRVAVRDRVPTLGICLGGQLLARALGGVVRKGVDGPELGGHLVAKKDVAAQDPVFSGVPFTPDVVQWHYDEIAELPVAAVLLAGSPLYPYQAFRVGECAWGIQFHIETTPEMVRSWAAGDTGQAAEWGLSVEHALASALAAHDQIAAVWRPAILRFADVVRRSAAQRAA